MKLKGSIQQKFIYKEKHLLYSQLNSRDFTNITPSQLFFNPFCSGFSPIWNSSSTFQISPTDSWGPWLLCSALLLIFSSTGIFILIHVIVDHLHNNIGCVMPGPMPFLREKADDKSVFRNQTFKIVVFIMNLFFIILYFAFGLLLMKKAYMFFSSSFWISDHKNSKSSFFKLLCLPFNWLVFRNRKKLKFLIQDMLKGYGLKLDWLKI